MTDKKQQENFLTLNLDDIMSDRFGRYSKYIIQERALPDARDGLKPVQRRILYAMDQAGNTYDKPHRKSAKTVGIVIGTYHPHGDTSVYDAMVRLSQDWKINLPLVDMSGNNGSIDDDPPAAMRYTEARLSKHAALLLTDLDKKTVPMTLNYDDTEYEPTVLPSRIPLLLVNGATGIASGYATNIAPHNLKEVIDATIYRIYHPDCSIDELMEYIKGPDFPTGGIVQGKENIKEVFKTGKGKVLVNSKCEIVESRNLKQIVITEIPYEVIKKNLVKRIDELRGNKELEGIVDLRDESGRDGLRIVIDIKKEADANLILHYLYKNSDLQINYNYNMIAIVDHAPVLMNLSTALDAFIAHRKAVYVNASRYLLEQKSARLHILEGLMKAISILDQIIEIIRESKDKNSAKTRLKEVYLFSDAQAEAILMMRLYRLSNTDLKALKDEELTLNKELSKIRQILSSTDLLNKAIVDDLKTVSEQHSSARKTKIEDFIENVAIDKKAMIFNESTYLSLTRDGYIRRYSFRTFQANPNTMPFFKENDELLGIKSCESHDTLLIITDRGNYGYLPIYDLPETKWKDLGSHFSHFLKSENGEHLATAFIVKKFDSAWNILTLSCKGNIKKTPLASLEVKRSSKTMNLMKLKDDDKLVKAFALSDESKILVASQKGFYTYYPTSEIPLSAPKAAGVRAIKLRDDELYDAAILTPEAKWLLVVSQQGGFKRIKVGDLKDSKRDNVGNRLCKVIKSRPLLIKNVRFLNDQTYLNIYDGESHIVPATTIPLLDADATFGNPLNLNADFFILQGEEYDIPTLVEISVPETFYQHVEQTSIF